MKYFSISREYKMWEARNELWRDRQRTTPSHTKQLENFGGSLRGLNNEAKPSVSLRVVKDESESLILLLFSSSSERLFKKLCGIEITNEGGKGERMEVDGVS
jgi:hypothetical protein